MQDGMSMQINFSHTFVCLQKMNKIKANQRNKYYWKKIICKKQSITFSFVPGLGFVKSLKLVFKKS